MHSGSIFYYFKTKEDILLAVMRESLRLITEAVLQARAAFAEPLQQLQAMIAAHLHVLLEEVDDFPPSFSTNGRACPQKARRKSASCATVTKPSGRKCLQDWRKPMTGRSTRRFSAFSFWAA